MKSSNIPELMWPDFKTALHYCTRELKKLGPYYKWNISVTPQRRRWQVLNPSSTYRLNQEIIARIQRCIRWEEDRSKLITDFRKAIVEGKEDRNADEINDSCGLGCF